MTERATISQAIQIGPEVTPGTEVNAGKLLASMELTGGIKASNEAFRPIGRKYASFVVPGQEWSEWKISGKVTYGEVVYPLCSILKNVTPTVDGTLPKLWTFAPVLSAADTVKTYTVEIGDSVRAHLFTYGIVTELGFKFSRKAGVEYDGVMLGGAISDGITMTSTPAAIEATPMPIAGSNICVYTADSWAGLSSPTQLTRVLSAEWRIGNRQNPVWTLDCSAASFVATVEAPPLTTAKFIVEADAAGMAFLTLMRNATQKWVRIKASGAEIESGKPYLFQIDGCYNVLEPEEFKDSDGVYAIGWGLEPVYDTVATKTYEFQVRNLVASL